MAKKLSHPSFALSGTDILVLVIHSFSSVPAWVNINALSEVKTYVEPEGVVGYR